MYTDYTASAHDILIFEKSSVVFVRYTLYMKCNSAVV